MISDEDEDVKKERREISEYMSGTAGVETKRVVAVHGLRKEFTTNEGKSSGLPCRKTQELEDESSSESSKILYPETQTF